MAENDYWKFNWDKTPWVQSIEPEKAKGNPEPTPVKKERKKIEKPPSQALLEFVEIDTSPPLKKDASYSGSGKLKIIEGATLTECSLYIQPLYRYKGTRDANEQEENCEQATEVFVDKETLTFNFTIENLFVPNAYYLDDEKPADAKYRLLVKVVGQQLDKDYYSPEIELPMESKEVI